MSKILEISDLNYSKDNRNFFKDFHLEIEKGSFISIIGPNKAGKSMLTKIICAIYPTTDKCILDGIYLNKENVLDYIQKIGIATNDFKSPFLFKKVKDELSYPLENLGYTSYKIEKIIDKILSSFEMEDIKDKNIDLLTESIKRKLLIILALIHEPKLLVLDDIFLDMNAKDQIFILKKLNELNKKGLTIINITSKLDTIYDSNLVYVLNKFKIEKILTINELFEEDSYLNKLGLKIPFVVDLSLKLKFYNLVDKIFYNLEELEDSLWK